MIDENKITYGVATILDGLGCSLLDQNFAGTPGRVARAYQELFAGLDNVEKQLEAILAQTFPCEHQQMIVANRIEVFGMCPHHLLPVRYLITVGYMPGDGGRVLGLSKLARVVTLLAARPVLQEQVVDDVVRALMTLPGCRGAGCIAHGEHMCMRMRGVKQSEAIVVTSALLGEFITDAMVRGEFMSLAHR